MSIHNYFCLALCSTEKQNTKIQLQAFLDIPKAVHIALSNASAGLKFTVIPELIQIVKILIPWEFPPRTRIFLLHKPQQRERVENYNYCYVEEVTEQWLGRRKYIIGSISIYEEHGFGNVNTHESYNKIYTCNGH